MKDISCYDYILTHYQILDSSKLKECSDDNFKLDENGRKLSKQVENTVGKGEIARYEQFLLFLQCFQKACFSGASKGVIVWEWVGLALLKTGVIRNFLSNLCKVKQIFERHDFETLYGFNLLPDDKTLDWSKLKQIANDILKCIQNEKEGPYKIENTVRKGEIACNKQFFPFFSQCFPQLYMYF